jgi:hypothetical protein
MVLKKGCTWYFRVSGLQDFAHSYFSDENAKFRKLFPSSDEKIRFDSRDHILLPQLSRYIFHLRTKKVQNSDRILYGMLDEGLLLWSSGQTSWLQNGDVLCFYEVRTEFVCYVEESILPLWSSGKSFWLQNGCIVIPVRYQIF